MTHTTMSAEFSRMYEPLERIPVLHACCHFELRLTRWYNPSDRYVGYVEAQSPCSTCSPQGRPVQPNYETLEAAQAEALANPR